MTTTVDTPTWDHGTLSSSQLESVLLDALSDLWANAYRRDSTLEFRSRHFRERLEKLCEAATGIPLAGLPATIRKAHAATVCGFCEGRPVHDAAEWADGKPRPPAPCPRCGQTAEPENLPVPLAAVPSPIGLAARKITRDEEARTNVDSDRPF